MNEGQKSLVFVCLAALSVLVAYVSKPKPVGTAPDEAIGKTLFENFNDPLTAKSLEIAKIDATKSQLSSFKVTQNSDGTWSIPSHSDYPADAENQLRDAATSLVNLSIIDVASEVQEDHEYFGVLTPDKDAKPGQEGVGVLVRMQDEKGANLAELVIGKADKQKADHRFVRKPTQDRVYVVKIDPNKFTTKFGDWIEKDLLKLNAFDVENVRLKDYSVSRTERAFRMDPRLDAKVRWNSEQSQWQLAEMSLFNRGKPIPTQLAENEELNKEKLDALKTAVDDLAIADVSRKPKGLTADLKAEAGFLSDQEGVESLFARGFFPLKPPSSDEVELYSANGEVHVGMKDGVEYVLRFGNVASVEEGSADTKLNRYLFVMARLDESKFAPPQLEPEPADVPADTKPTTPPAKPEEKPAAAGQSGGNGGGDAAADQDAKADDKPEAKAADDEKAKASEKPDAKPAETKPETKPDAEPKAEEKGKPEEPKSEAKKPEEKKSDPAAERERIKRDNQRKLDEFKERRTKAENRVKELNARFADWYYIISEDTYKKIHLGRADIVKEKSAASSDEGIGIDSFRKLAEEGLKKGSAPGKPDDHDHDDDAKK